MMKWCSREDGLVLVEMINTAIVLIFRVGEEVGLSAVWEVGLLPV